MNKLLKTIAGVLLLGIGSARAGDFPALHHRNVSPERLAKATAAADARAGLWIVQFERGARLRAPELAAAGLEVVGYVPDNGWILALGDEAPKRLASLPRSRLIPYAGELKLAAGIRPGVGELLLQARPGLSAGALRRALDTVPGLEILAVGERFGVATARLRTPDDATLAASAALEEVLWIEPRRIALRHNSESVGVIQANLPSGGTPPLNTPIWDQGILGSGQIVAVADSGLDRNEDWFLSIDPGDGPTNAATDAEAPEPPQPGPVFPERKVVAYWVQPGASPYDDSEVCRDGGFPGTYHGTHVTGTVAGDAGAVATPRVPNHETGDGMAPNAQILFQDIGNDETGCLSITDFAATIAQAHAGGARIHNNSWGAVPEDDAGNFDQAYYFNDFNGDLATFELHDLLLVTSAGNNEDDYPGQATIGPPANGKNVLAVGATERGDNPAIASFSSRGPGHDGRIKPDIVAPGVDIVSARGDNDDTIPPPLFGGSQSIPKSGTSMAAPTVSGGAALARQYFTEGFYPSGARNADDALTPSGALLKATLLNGTRLYADTPSTASGWGRLWLDQVLFFAGEQRRLRLWDLARGHGLATGEVHEYEVDVAGGEPLRVTLAWFDPPATSGTGRALVNDLDLTVIGPAGTYLGNVITGGESATGGSRDELNPVEQVMLGNPSPGRYTLRVSAANVPGNAFDAAARQSYALISSAAGCDGVPGAPTLEARLTAGGVALRADGPVELYRAPGSCEARDATPAFIGASRQGEFMDSVLVPGETYAYRARAVNSCGVSAFSACKSISLGAQADLDVSGPWFNAEQSGHGWFIEQLPPLEEGGRERVNAYWYVYLDGAPVWLIAQGELDGDTAVLDAFITSGADFPPAFEAEDVDLRGWGTLTLRFEGDGAALASWEPFEPGFAAGELAIERLAAVSRAPEACVSGSYFNPDQSGHGFVAEVLEVQGGLELLLAWYVYLEGEQLWLLGQAPLLDGAAEVPLARFSGADFPPDFDPGAVNSENWGSVSVSFQPPDAARVDWTPEQAAFEAGGLDLVRLTQLVDRTCPSAN